MATQIHYRLTVYAGTLVSDTSTALTPAATAPHSDSFKVTTHPNLSGWRPYLRIPQGKRGTLDLRTARADVGTFTVELLDKRTGTGNSERWISAFIGNDAGALSIIGKKAMLEESTDGGSTWIELFVGRVNALDLSSLLTVSMTIACVASGAYSGFDRGIWVIECGNHQRNHSL
jgi:hypothetical protein